VAVTVAVWLVATCGEQAVWFVVRSIIH
jgi:hypothetical protein